MGPVQACAGRTGAHRAQLARGIKVEAGVQGHSAVHALQWYVFWLGLAESVCSLSQGHLGQVCVLWREAVVASYIYQCHTVRTCWNPAYHRLTDCQRSCATITHARQQMPVTSRSFSNHTSIRSPALACCHCVLAFSVVKVSARLTQYSQVAVRYLVRLERWFIPCY